MTLDLTDFTQAVLIFAINAESDPAERAAKIAIALKDGHITEADAAILRRAA